MILFNMAACFFPGYANMAFKWKTLFTMKNAPDRTTIKYFPFMPGLSPGEWTIIDRFIPPEEPIGYFGDLHCRLFQYYDNKMVRKIYHLGNFPGYTLFCDKGKYLALSQTFKTELRERHIHFIHFNFNKNRKVGIKDKDIDHLTGGLFYYRWGTDGGENEKE